MDKIGNCISAPCPIIASSAAVSNGIVYFGSSDAFAYALNAATGALVWKQQLGDSNAGDDIWTSPAVFNGLVYFGIASHNDAPCVVGRVIAVNASTGAVAWTFTTIDPTSCPSGTCVGAGVWSSPAIDTAAGILYIGTGNPGFPCNPSTANATRWPDSILALNASTGKLLNYFQTIPNDTTDLDVGASPVLFKTGTVNACTGANSTRNWVMDPDKNGNLYVLQRNSTGLIGNLHQFNLNGCCDTLATPGLIPKTAKSACSSTQFTTSYSDNLFPPTVTGHLWNINASPSGAMTVAWDLPISTSKLFSAPATINNLVFFGSADHNLRAVSSAGSVVWKFLTNARIDAGPAISNGRIYIVTGAGSLYVFSINGQ